jgi:hypothetical protein
MTLSRAAATPPPATSPPVFPSGATAGTEKSGEVTRLLEAAAYFPVLNVHDPAIPNDTVPLLPIATQTLFTAVNVNEQLQRFEVVTEMGGPQGLHALNAISSDPVANVTIRFTPIPDDYAPSPGVSPPPTLLNPFASQRFTFVSGQLSFQDRLVSGVRAFGSGRTFPAGGGSLNLAAVIDVLQGFGGLYGLTDGTLPGATMVGNGFITPPNDLALNITLRVMDPHGQLAASTPVPPLVQAGPTPAGSGTFMFFLGEADPRRPVRLLYGNGVPIGAQMFENLRLVRIGFDKESLQSSTQPGPIVGTASSLLYCNFQNEGTVTTAQTTGGVFSFHDLQRRSLGSLFINMVEGRAFRTALPGAPWPVFRLGGFGPFLNGTGSFAGATGMMTVNGAISAFPPTLSNLYILRFLDSGGPLQEQLQATGFLGAQ